MLNLLLKIVSRLAIGKPSTIRLMLVALVFIFGQTVDAQQKIANTLLWEISGKNLHQPSYLFGTYHLADKGFVDTMKTVNEKLKAADAIVGEIVINNQMAMELLPYIALKNTTLSELLKPDEYQLVADYFKKETTYDLKDFNTLKPIAIQTIIMQAIAPKTITKDNPVIDQYFQEYGKANGKNVLGLETVKEQAAILFGNSIERQIELLLKSVKESDKDKEQLNKLYQLYITQNMKGMETLFLNDTSFTPEEMAALLTNRNAKWMEKLPAMMQVQSLFIAVGAGHLVGKDGLIKGLQDKGYTVKPVKTN